MTLTQIGDPAYLLVMLTSPLCRAARGWLGWTQQQLADASGVSLSAIKDFEKGKRVPIQANLKALTHALEDAEIVFGVDNEGRFVGLSGPMPE